MTKVRNSQLIQERKIKMNDQQQKEAQKLLNEYVSYYLKWHGKGAGDGEEKAVTRRNGCYDSTAFPSRQCCLEHIVAGKKFREFRERFQKIWPTGFEKNFPHGYHQRGFFQKFVAAFNLTVNPSEIGLMWAEPGVGYKSPAQHWNDPDTTLRYD